MMALMTQPNRPWDFSIHGRARMSDSEVEALADRAGPSRVTLFYDSVAEELTLRGYTSDVEPWAAIGWLLNWLSAILPGNRFQLITAEVREGDTDEEVMAYLAGLGLGEGSWP